MAPSVMSAPRSAPWKNSKPRSPVLQTIPDPNNREAVILHVGELIGRRLGSEGRMLVSCLVLAYQGWLEYPKVLEIVDMIQRIDEAARANPDSEPSLEVEAMRKVMQEMAPGYFGKSPISETAVSPQGGAEIQGAQVRPEDLVSLVEEALAKHIISPQIADLIRERAEKLLKWLDAAESIQFMSAIVARVRYLVEEVPVEQTIGEDGVYLDMTKEMLDICNQRELVVIYLKSRLRSEQHEWIEFPVEEAYDPRIISQELDKYLRKLLFERRRIQGTVRK